MEGSVVNWAVAFVTLSVMEVVLGIDNIIFVAIIVGKLPQAMQPSARMIGLGLALVLRLGLLFTIGWILSLRFPLFFLSQFGLPDLPEDHHSHTAGVSVENLILIAGGLFLIFKATKEIHDKLEGKDEEAGGRAAASYGWAIGQIIAIDLVFSLDSVITAVGMTNDFKDFWTQMSVIIAAMLVAVGTMMAFAGTVSDFVHKHPTLKMLALSFLILIGVLLVAEGLHQYISKWYVYTAMAFSVAVEALNMRVRSKGKAVELNQPTMPASQRTTAPTA